MKLRTLSTFARNAIAGCFKRDVRLHIPPPQPAATGPLIERIRRAFLAMQADAPKQADWWRPSKEWEKQLARAYADLSDERPERFGHFLANFGCTPIYNGIEETGFWAARVGRYALGRRYIEEALFRKTLSAWRAFRRPMEGLDFPPHGRQVSALIDGHRVGPGLMNDILGAQVEMLLPETPVLAEIGAGYGKLAWCALRNQNSFRYIDIDLPQTLCCAAYYLGLSFPNKRLWLYGEPDRDIADLVFLPPWMIDSIPSTSVDVWLNKNSFGEMAKATCRRYLSEIGRTVRGYLFHLNHDTIRFGDAYLAHEYPVPNHLRLVSKQPDIGHLLVYTDRQIDTFQYLYRA